MTKCKILNLYLKSGTSKALFFRTENHFVKGKRDIMLPKSQIIVTHKKKAEGVATYPRWTVKVPDWLVNRNPDLKKLCQRPPSQHQQQD